MKTPVLHSAFFALLGLLLSPLAVAHALSPPADSVHFYAPFDYEQWRRDHPRPAAKRLAETEHARKEQESKEDEGSTEDFRIREPSRTVRATFGLTAFYQQWIDVEGFPVVASENVNPYAVKEAAWLIRQLMSHRPDVLQAMVQNKARFTVIAYNEMLTQIPEYSDLRPDFYWDLRARGLGGGGRPSSFGEENLLNYPGDPYEGANLLIHEFAHSIHLDGLNTVEPDFDNRLQAAFEAAIARGLWEGTYASTNRQEYWGEGVSAWFNAQFELRDINTRTKLKDYDPELAKLLAEVFGDTDWRYTPPATRTHLPHLQGFNPQDSPTFEWPPELAACYHQLFDLDGDGGDKWVNLDPHNPSQLSRLRSPGYRTGETEIIFVNESGAEITYYWIDSDGTEIYLSRLVVELQVLWAYVGQIFLIKDQHGNNLAVFRAEEKTGRVFIGPIQANTLAETSDDEQQETEQEATTDGQSMAQTLATVSGGGQEGLAGEQLAEPLVVSVLDQDGSAFAGAVVTFWVTAGEGTLSAARVPTDANGRAATRLTLGSELGINIVVAIVEGLAPVTFTATATERMPHSLDKVSGEGQEGPASTQLDEPLVVSVLDQGGAPLAGVDVTFAVTDGEGLLSATTDTNPCTIEASTSATTATTDANGQATTRLTLGSQPGTHTVEATVEGLESVTFTATAAEQAIPHHLTKVCGEDQEGPAITQLAEPLVVFVSDENGAALAGVVVSFAVTAGGGTLSATTATTDANGRAATRLTLGIEAGINAVAATVEGLEPVIFTATAQESPFANLFDLFQSGKRVALPDRPQLAQNAPNPFNSQTVLSYFLSAPGPARLEVFSLTGQRVAVLRQGPQQAGYHRLYWDGRDDAGRSVASGAYLYRLVTDEAVLTRKLLLLR